MGSGAGVHRARGGLAAASAQPLLSVFTIQCKH